MTKITLTDLANLQNENTAVSAINSNNAILETAFDNTLSRDGTTPNQMGANLDMNSNHILNLPSPSSADEPVRLQDLADYATGGTVTFNGLPFGGATGATLVKNSTADNDAVWGGNSLSFDKRSDVTTSRIPSSITSITINRYDTGYPIQPATYVRGNNGILNLTDAGGNPWDLPVTTGATAEVYAYPEWFGAKHDGTTDDAPAFRSCMSYLKPLQPATMYLGSGTYLMGTVSSGSCILIYNGVSIKGEGDSSVLKLKTNISPAASFALMGQLTGTSTDRVDNVTYSDFKIDGNVAGNTYNIYMPGIYSSHNFNMTIDNVYIQNWPGSQAITLGQNAGIGGLSVIPTSVNPRVQNCRFLDVGNSTLSDVSDIYVVSTDFVVNNNWCEQTIQSSVGTAIEVHGTGVCTDNVMRFMNKAYNVGAYPDTHAILTGNIAYSVNCFVTIWDTLGGANPDFVTNCIVSHNMCFTASSAVYCAVDMSSTRGTQTSHVKISDNYFESLEAAATASTQGVVQGVKIQHVEVYNNTAVNYPGSFYLMAADPITNISTLRIDNNTILDCGRSSFAPAKQAIYLSTVNNLAVLSIKNNTIRNTSTVYMTTGILGSTGLTATTGRGCIFNNIISNVTTPINWTGSSRMEGIWIAYTPTLSGNGTIGTSTAAGRYKILGDTLFLDLTAVVSGGPTSNTDMNFTLPASLIATNLDQSLGGREKTLTNKGIAAVVLASNNLVNARYADAATIWTNTAAPTISGSIQITP